MLYSVRMKKEENLREKILSWLDTQGYGTEMKVATSLRNADHDVIQSFFYNDPETKVSREIDVVSRISDVIGLLSVSSVIECKKSKKPWILFTSEHANVNRIWSFAIMGEIARNAIIENIKPMLNIDWFRKDGRTAYGITEAFTSKEDETFKAGVTATKAAISLNESKSFGDIALSFFFPTVVLDGQLFECYFDKEGKFVLEEINSAFLQFPIRFGEYHGASIRVVTLDAFANYCQELNTTYQLLKQILKTEIEKQATLIGIPLQSLHRANH